MAFNENVLIEVPINKCQGCKAFDSMAQIKCAVIAKAHRLTVRILHTIIFPINAIAGETPPIMFPVNTNGVIWKVSFDNISIFKFLRCRVKKYFLNLNN